MSEIFIYRSFSHWFIDVIIAQLVFSRKIFYWHQLLHTLYWLHATYQYQINCIPIDNTFTRTFSTKGYLWRKKRKRNYLMWCPCNTCPVMWPVVTNDAWLTIMSCYPGCLQFNFCCLQGVSIKTDVYYFFCSKHQFLLGHPVVSYSNAALSLTGSSLVPHSHRISQQPVN